MGKNKPISVCSSCSSCSSCLAAGACESVARCLAAGGSVRVGAGFVRLVPAGVPDRPLSGLVSRLVAAAVAAAC